MFTSKIHDGFLSNIYTLYSWSTDKIINSTSYNISPISNSIAIYKLLMIYFSKLNWIKITFLT